MQKENDTRAGPRPGESPKAAAPSNRRLVVGVVLIAGALAALAAAEYFREHPAPGRPPHEPSQALIAPPAPERNPAEMPLDRPAEPPPPPEVINNETLRPPARHIPPVSRPDPAKPASPVKPEPPPAKGYVVQLGVFSSPANAEALKTRLSREGIEARIETRVQLGPFGSRKEAEKALANAKKLGVTAVLVPPR